MKNEFGMEYESVSPDREIESDTSGWFDRLCNDVTLIVSGLIIGIGMYYLLSGVYAGLAARAVYRGMS